MGGSLACQSIWWVWFHNFFPIYSLFRVVSRFAKEKIQPLVRDMDNASEMNKSVINALFEQGVSGLARRVPTLYLCLKYLVHYDKLDYRPSSAVMHCRWPIV